MGYVGRVSHVDRGLRAVNFVRIYNFTSITVVDCCLCYDERTDLASFMKGTGCNRLQGKVVSKPTAGSSDTSFPD